MCGKGDSTSSREGEVYTVERDKLDGKKRKIYKIAIGENINWKKEGINAD